MTGDDLYNLDTLRALEQKFGELLADVRRKKDIVEDALTRQGERIRVVTDHALLRYLERHKGIDLEAVRNEMRAIADASVAVKDGEHHWHPSGTIMVLSRDGRIITVLSPEQAAKFSGRKLINGTYIAEQQAHETTGHHRLETE